MSYITCGFSVSLHIFSVIVWAPGGCHSLMLVCTVSIRPSHRRAILSHLHLWYAFSPALFSRVKWRCWKRRAAVPCAAESFQVRVTQYPTNREEWACSRSLMFVSTSHVPQTIGVVHIIKHTAALAIVKLQPDSRSSRVTTFQRLQECSSSPLKGSARV